MLVRLRQQVGRAHEQEEARVEREQVAERVLGDLEIVAPTVAPISGAIASTASQVIARRRLSLWLRMKLTVFMPSAKSCATTATNTSSPVVVLTPNASPIPRPSMKLCIESPAAPRTPTCSWARACSASSRWCRTSARSARKKIRKPSADEPGDASGVADRVDRLRQHVEERDADHDPACERDQRRQLAMQPQRDDPAGQRGQDGQRRERDRDPVHAQFRQVP